MRLVHTRNPGSIHFHLEYLHANGMPINQKPPPKLSHNYRKFDVFLLSIVPINLSGACCNEKRIAPTEFSPQASPINRRRKLISEQMHGEIAWLERHDRKSWSSSVREKHESREGMRVYDLRRRWWCIPRAFTSVGVSWLSLWCQGLSVKCTRRCWTWSRRSVLNRSWSIIWELTSTTSSSDCRTSSGELSWECVESCRHIVRPTAGNPSFGWNYPKMTRVQPNIIGEEGFFQLRFLPSL